MEPIAFISDIHANFDALEAVLADIEKHHLRRVLCLGDIVGYGPEPARCVERVQQAVEVALLGNHDAMMNAQGFELGSLAGRVAAPLLLARNELTADQRNWLENLPLTSQSETCECSHANLSEPALFRYVLKPHDVARHFSRQQASFSFFGHSHIPGIFRSDERGKLSRVIAEGKTTLPRPHRYAVCVGSTAFSRDGDPRACWTEFDPALRTVEFHRVHYDLEATKAKMTAAFGTDWSKGS